ncbi:MAG TPA: hypothetical protein VMF88_04030 [Bacteroidota bacterium]|nr:hypothetical protein [Bacteroidota bacterium]
MKKESVVAVLFGLWSLFRSQPVIAQHDRFFEGGAYRDLSTVRDSFRTVEQDPWRLTLLSDEVIAAGTLDSLHEGVLYATKAGRALILPVDSIAVIERHVEGHFWTGAIFGLIGGSALGGLFAEAAHGQDPGISPPASSDAGHAPALVSGFVIGGMGGFVVGGIIGSSPSSGNGTYTLTGKKMREKIAALQMIILENN